MRQHGDDLVALNLAVVVVTFETRSRVEWYVRDTGVLWPILIDGNLETYSQYGMRKGAWWNLYGPAAWWVYARLLVRGRRLRIPRADVTQLGGDVLIDPAGIVRLHHVGNGPADRPPIPTLLNVVRSGSSAVQNSFAEEP